MDPFVYSRNCLRCEYFVSAAKTCRGHSKVVLEVSPSWRSHDRDNKGEFFVFVWHYTVIEQKHPCCDTGGRPWRHLVKSTCDIGRRPDIESSMKARKNQILWRQRNSQYTTVASDERVCTSAARAEQMTHMTTALREIPAEIFYTFYSKDSWLIYSRAAYLEYHLARASLTN